MVKLSDRRRVHEALQVLREALHDAPPIARQLVDALDEAFGDGLDPIEREALEAES